MACVVSSSCDSKADVCASISVLSSAISSGPTRLVQDLPVQGAIGLPLGKVSHECVVLWTIVYLGSMDGLSPGAGNGWPWTFLRTQNPGKISHREMIH